MKKDIVMSNRIDICYYSLLGITYDASQDAIKAAYRALARQYHPDINPGDPDAAEHFRTINEAYDTLRHLERRRSYDVERHIGRQSAAASAGGFSWKEFLNANKY